MEKEKLIRFFQHILPMPTDKAQQVAHHFTEKKIAKNDYLLKEGRISFEKKFQENSFLPNGKWAID